MAIVAKATGGNFIPAPAGTWAAVCCDVVDLGVLEVTFAGQTKKQHKIRIVWQIDESREDGKPHQASKRYTLSLHEKASLRKDLESWRGRAFTEEELKGFDVETVLAVACMLNVVEQKKEGKTYSNVTAIMKLPKSMQAPKIRDYVRVCDRQPDDATPQERDDYDPLAGLGIDDTDVPF